MLKITSKTFVALDGLKDLEVPKNINSPVFFSGIPPGQGKNCKLPEMNITIAETLKLLDGERPPIVVSYESGHYWGYVQPTAPGGGADWLEHMRLERQQATKRKELEFVPEHSPPAKSSRASARFKMEK